METAVVSVAVGVMKPLLVKLTMLMGDEYKKLTEVRKQVPFFKDELSAMSNFLEKLADYDQLDPQIKGWRDRVRDMAYDIEDSIDNFIICHDSNTASVGFLEKMRHHLKRVKEYRQISSQFKELRRRVVEESERYKRYKTDDLMNSCKISGLQNYSSSTVAVDPRVTALYKESASLVGIDAPREELVKRLANKEQQLNVISIVGFGGLGKTTLAKEVYQNIGDQFDCKAFVSVSQRPDLTRVLKDIQTNLGTGCSSCDVRDILDSLTVHLKNKRYFVVVDDLWDMPEWDVIVCAFQDNNKGSRVIVTTRVEDVASRASSNRQCIYRMKPLNDQDSRRLFLNRIFGSENDCPSHYKEVSAQILKKCGGLPLAINTIASLLASRPERLMDEWETIRNSLGDPFSTNPTLEGMREILDLSYKNLPHHLRACLLYLGKYPEDHEIKRDDVVRQWMAEGFIVSTCRRHGDEEDVAKSYFNELVNRSLIQPERSDCGEVLSCRVHDMMLDLILKRCTEDNFISVACSSEEVAREHKYKIRRLSLHSSAEIGASDGISLGTITTSLSKVRSLSLIGECMWRLPLLPFHKYLRVLDLQVRIREYRQTAEKTSSWLAKQVDLTVIGQLYQLRYLKLGCCAHDMKLPHKISGLVHLETLELVKDSNMPSDVADLPRLSRLDVHWGQCMPGGLGKMKSLRTLAGFDLLSLDTKAIGELTNLKDLRLCCAPRGTSVPAGRDLEKMLCGGAFSRESIVARGSHQVQEKKLCFGATGIDVSVVEGIGSLYSSLGKLRSLRYLEIRPWGRVVFVDDGNYQLGSLSDPPSSIEILKLKGFLFSRIPKWIRAGALNNLRRLELLVSGASTDEVAVLGELPSLMHFVLELEAGPPAVNGIVFSAGLFPALESLCFHFCDADATSYMGFQFQEGVMPRLRRLTLQFDHREWQCSATPVGMEHLLALQHIRVEFQDHQETYDGSYPPPSNFCSDAERALRNAVESLPSRPSFTLEWGKDRWRRSAQFDHARS